MMVIDNKFTFGQEVYLKTDEDQKKRIVTMMKITCSGEITYQLSCGTSYADHYEFEITDKVDIIAKTTN